MAKVWVRLRRAGNVFNLYIHCELWCCPKKPTQMSTHTHTRTLAIGGACRTDQTTQRVQGKTSCNPPLSLSLSLCLFLLSLSEAVRDFYSWPLFYFILIEVISLFLLWKMRWWCILRCETEKKRKEKKENPVVYRHVVLVVCVKLGGRVVWCSSMRITNCSTD